MKPSTTQFAAIVKALGADDLTEKGLPKMHPLNAMLAHHGFDEIDAKTRDAWLADIDADHDEAPKGDGEDEDVQVHIIASRTDPVELRVGRETWKMWVGQTYPLPPYAVEALGNSDVDFITPDTE